MRGGYIFSREHRAQQHVLADRCPIPTATCSVPASAMRITRMNVDVVYQYSLSEDRTVRTAQTMALGDVDGTWKSDGHAVMVTSTLKF